MKTDNQITLYETEDGKARIAVRFEREEVWLTQRLMAELFECSVEYIAAFKEYLFRKRTGRKVSYRGFLGS